MKCYMNLRYDHDQLVRAALVEHGYIAEANDDDLRRQLSLYDLRAKMVPVKPYRVHFSRELIANPCLPDLKGRLDELVDRMRRGLTIAPFLSVLASRLKSRDYLLMHWGLHHVHLSPLSTLNAKGFVDRSDHLLFFRVDKSNIYLVDVVRHKEYDAFEREELVRILDRNWPHLLGELGRICNMSRHLEPSEIKKLRKGNVNMGGVKSGRRMVIPAFGTMTSGHSLEGLLKADRVARELRNIESLVKHNYLEWFPKSSAWATSIQLVGLDGENCYQLRDNSTGYVSKLVRESE